MKCSRSTAGGAAAATDNSSGGSISGLAKLAVCCFVFALPAPSAAAVDRDYELVSPPDKISGVGVGSYDTGDAAAGVTGFPSRDGQRYAVETGLGSPLLDSKFAYATDWAFAERQGDDVGWLSHSPFTHSNFGFSSHRFAAPSAASANLSLISWESNAGHIAVFEEAEAFSLGWGIPTLSDWQGRWEVFAPTDDDQGDPGSAAPTAVSADGAKAVLTTEQDKPWVGGFPDAGDPFIDRTGGPASYLDDVSLGLSDNFPGAGIREPVGTCDAGTLIPNVDGTGDIGTRSCPAPNPGRSAALVDPGGATIAVPSALATTVLESIVSEDGSRVFFRSPNTSSFGGLGGINTTLESPCFGSDSSTVCPSQLYVRHEESDGDVATRWISQSKVTGQDASLLGAAVFEGATPDGDKVFFRSDSPLTPDDPNGAGVPAPPGGVTTGSASQDSWDLFRYDFTDDPDDDPGAGSLTRVSAGPAAGDANLALESGVFPVSAALRSVSDDGTRAYFVTSGVLPGVPPPNNGTITNPAGAPSDTETRNLYLYENDGGSESWRFIAHLPASSNLQQCATKGSDRGSPFSRFQDQILDGINCLNGNSDGSFITFLTDGRLTADDPDSVTVDIYGYDADADQLTRVSAPQGGAGNTYACATGLACYGDGGFGNATAPRLGLATQPAAGERVAFFQSKSRLVSEDIDGQYDVYEWRNGELSLLSPGTDDGAYYSGNSADGDDVFFLTHSDLSWQDVDAVMDVYTSRVGGGIPQPAPTVLCNVLVDNCQGVTPPPTLVSPSTAGPGDGNTSLGDRLTLLVSTPSSAALRRAATKGVIKLRVRASGPGVIGAAAHARLGKRARQVASDSERLTKAGPALVRLRLNKAARRRLRSERSLRLAVRVRMFGARTQSMNLVLRRTGK